MPDEPLPIFNGDPFTSMFGVMRFPGDLEKAETYACWRLTFPNPPARRLSPVTLRRVAERASHFARITGEAAEAEKKGSAVGAITAILWNMAKAKPEEASWTAATEAAKRLAMKSKPRAPISSSSAYAWRQEFRRVLHFWGIQANNGYAWPTDPVSALAQADALLDTLRGWGKTRGVLLENCFRSPFPLRMMRVGDELPADMLPTRKKSGRRPSPK